MTTPADTDQLILVDEHDNEIGYAPKLAAHRNGGQLHRAFSVFLFNRSGEMLLQRRATGKYHFGGLWTNACCSHPRRGQTTLDAARMRLQEELGIVVDDLRERFTFTYRAADPASGLTEHELDHVLTGRFDGVPQPNPEEVGEWRWVRPTELLVDIARRPDAYTPWFKIVVERVVTLGANV